MKNAFRYCIVFLAENQGRNCGKIIYLLLLFFCVYTQNVSFLFNKRKEKLIKVPLIKLISGWSELKAGFPYTCTGFLRIGTYSTAKTV